MTSYFCLPAGDAGLQRMTLAQVPALFACAEDDAPLLAPTSRPALSPAGQAWRLASAAFAEIGTLLRREAAERRLRERTVAPLFSA